MTWSERRLSRARGQSEALAAVLLVAIVMTALGLIAATGFGALSSTQDQYGHAVAENQLVDLAAATEDVAFSSTSTKSVELQLTREETQGHTYIRAGEGSIRVAKGGSVLYSGSLGTIVYKPSKDYDGPASIGYQGGGVFQRTPSGVSVVDEPPVSAADSGTRTVTLPVFRVQGDGRLTSGVTITQRKLVDAYPSKTVATSETVTVTIESRYYRGWGRYFQDALDVPASNIQYIDSDQRVEVTLGAGEELFLHLRVYTFDYTGDA